MLTLSFNYNFAHSDNVDEEDYLRVTLEGESRDEVVLEIFGLDEEARPGQWRSFSFDATSFAGETVTILIEAADSDGDGSIVEAAVDDVLID